MKRQKPEEIVNAELRSWFHVMAWVMQRVESKAVWSPAAGRYRAGMTLKFTSDWFGCTDTGRAAFIEAKAPGKRHTLKPGQRDYLTERIKAGAFAVCVDSVDMLDSIFTDWLIRLPHTRASFLLEKLPPPPQRRPR